MTNSGHRAAPTKGRRSHWSRRNIIAMGLQPLEQRLMLHHANPVPDLDDHVVYDADATALTLAQNAQAADAKAPLSSLPSLSSDPSATVDMYLDFVGAPAMNWLSYKVPQTPAFDQDGDPTSFNPAELTAINDIWRAVADAYSPFNINVTTVDPGPLVHGKNLEVIIGGSDAWLGAAAGGVSYISAFTTSYLPNISFVFPAQLANGTPKYTAMATAHEAGHQLGLYHQAAWSGNSLIADYSDNGHSTLTAPIMGNSYFAARALWWYGPNDISSTTMQDDMAVIAGPANGFGYRPADDAESMTNPTVLSPVGDSLAQAGIISTTSDVDYFQFSTGAGLVSLSVGGLLISDALGTYHGMLAPKLSLYDANNQLIRTSDSGLSDSMSMTLAAGNYIIAVGSHGGYGDVGQYTLTGTVAALTPAAPSGVIAAASGQSTINLSWSGTGDGQSDFTVQRSTDQQNWITIGSTTETNYQDTGLAAATIYYYRINASNDYGTGAYSAVASATTGAAGPPDVVSDLTVTSISFSDVNLSWQIGVSEEKYLVQRSSDQLNWATIANVVNASNYDDKNVQSNSRYGYRVIAYNAIGQAPASDVVSVMTPLYSVIVDNDDPAAIVQGSWYLSNGGRGYYGADCLQDGDINKGTSAVTFAPTLAQTGTYQVLMWWTSAPNRADNVPVQVHYSDGDASVNVNERSNGGQWVALGEFNFQAGKQAAVTVSNAGTRGFVSVDAMEFVKISNTPAAAPRLTANVTPANRSSIFSAAAIST